MKLRVFKVICLVFVCSSVWAQDVLYRIELKDKGTPAFTVEHPEEYLSARAIERRHRQGIAIDSTDLPIDSEYLRQIRLTGVTIRSYSKWMKTVVVSSLSENLGLLNQLAFVDTIYPVWRGNLPILQSKSLIETEQRKVQNRSSNNIDYYGAGSAQMDVNNGKPLHQAGYKGHGMWIALLDAGFQNVNKISLFNQQQILGYKNFTHLVGDSFNWSSDKHGTSVLSCMLSNTPGTLVGTAPEAEYFLLTSEVKQGEFLVEEDYWMAAIEYADSLGVDVVNSSLGYTTFDDASMNHTQSQLDGKTILISRSAHLAAEKGMLLFLAAGNDGGYDWHNISSPSDADGVMCVGAVNKDKQVAWFSGRGPSADSRVKPDAMAMGVDCGVIDASGIVSTIGNNGTSFASPILAGLSACLWQALPQLSSKDIIRLLRENSDHYTNPDADYGYGIPNIYNAYLSVTSNIKPIRQDQVVFLDSGSHRLHITQGLNRDSGCTLALLNSLGKKVLDITSVDESIDLTHLSSGLYIVVLQLGDKRYVNKIIR